MIMGRPTTIPLTSIPLTVLQDPDSFDVSDEVKREIAKVMSMPIHLLAHKPEKTADQVRAIIDEENNRN